MRRNHLLRPLICLMLLLSISPSMLPADERPNIVLIMADDMGLPIKL